LDEPIVIMSRDESVSGTEEFFRQSVLDGMPMSQQTVRVLDHNIVSAVWKRKGSIADARFSEAIRGKVQGKVSVVGLRESDESPVVLPSAETIRNRTYPISAPLVLYYDGRSSSPGMRDFASFCSRRGLGEIYAGRKSTEIR
jgi:phosphate transport system substrate-binding protein